MSDFFLIAKIERTLRLLDGLAFDGVGVDHGGPHISVSQKFLDGPDIIVGL